MAAAAPNRPNFVTKAMLDDIADRERAEERARNERQFRSSFNTWWQNTVLPALTDPKCFNNEYGAWQCRLQVPSIHPMTLEDWVKAADQRLLETSAPYQARKCSLGPCVRFMCVK